MSQPSQASAMNETTAAQVLDTESAPNAPEAAQAPPKDEKISPKLRMLLGREKTALEKERAAKAKEADILAKEKALSDREARIQEFESLKKTNPIKALELLGLSYDDLTQIKMNEGEVPAEIKLRELEDKLNSSLTAQEEAERKRSEAAKQLAEKEEARALETFQTEINEYLKENASRYEFIEFEQAHDLVYGVIDEHYNRTQQAAVEKLQAEGGDPTEAVGEVITIAQAADKVEAHLEKKYDKVRSLNKMKTLLSLKTEKTEPKPNTTESQKPKTLNNNLSATQSRPLARVLTDDERVQKAIAYAKGLRP